MTWPKLSLEDILIPGGGVLINVGVQQWWGWPAFFLSFGVTCVLIGMLLLMGKRGP